MNKNNIFRVKVSFEEIPIADQEIRGVEDMDRFLKTMQKKFRGNR